jgi:integrase
VQTSLPVLAKTNAKFWESRVRIPSGRATFGVHLNHEGRRRFFDLRTPDRRAAASRARTLYADLLRLGWVGLIEQHRPHAARKDAPPVEQIATVGELCEAVGRLSTARPASVRASCAALRRIAADVSKIEAGKGRYAAKGAGRAAWLAAVNAISLTELTPARIEAWKLAYVANRAKLGEVKARAARNSCNSLLRQAKACCTKRLLRLMAEALKMPHPLPFEGVEFFPRQSMRYTGGVDVESVIVAANTELAQTDPEAFKAFLLALFAGLRRNEIDKLRWRSIDFDRCTVSIEAMPDFAPKAETSLGAVPLEPEVAGILRDLRAKEPRAIYFLQGDTSNVLKKTWHAYRAQSTFDRLTQWLRAHGIDTQRPLHTLRKEAGSLVCKSAGLFAASRFLRHADTQVTAMHYIEHRNAAVVGLGSLLAPLPASVKTGDFSEPIATKAKQRRAAQ